MRRPVVAAIVVTSALATLAVGGYALVAYLAATVLE